MNASEVTESLGKVLLEEDDEIRRRREIAGINPPGDALDRQARPPLQQSLVGLALSGGGLRSAIFNLGLLQALSHRGLLKYVDYLSSVSGGGYIAGHLAVKATQYRNVREPTDPQSYHSSEKNKAFGVCPRTGRHLPDYRFKHAGGYLHDMTGWFGGWLGGTLVTVLLFLTGFGVIATLLALYWRSVDSPWFRDRAKMLGVGDIADELEWAFLPALPFLCIWVAVLAARWVDRWFGRGSGQWLLNIWGLIGVWLALVPVLRISGLDGRSSATVAFWLSLIPTVLPVTPGFWQKFFMTLGVATAAVLAATGLGPLLSLDHGFWSKDLGRGVTATLLVLVAFGGPLVIVRGYVSRHIVDADPYRYPSRWMTIAAIAAIIISVAVFLGNSVTQISGSVDRYDNQWTLNSTATWFAIGAGLIQLMTLVGIDRLFRSEATEASSWQRIAFNTIITLVIVLPLFAMVHWMAREDISGFAEHRDPDLLATDFREWNAVPDALDDLPSLERILDEHSVTVGGATMTLENGLHETNRILVEKSYAIVGQPEWRQRELRLTAGFGLWDRFQLIYLGDLFYGEDSKPGPDRFTEFLNAQNNAEMVRLDAVAFINGRDHEAPITSQGLGSQELTTDLIRLVALKVDEITTPTTGTPAKSIPENQNAALATDTKATAATVTSPALDEGGIDVATLDTIGDWLWKRADDPNDKLMAVEGGTFLRLWDRYAKYGLQPVPDAPEAGNVVDSGSGRGLDLYETRRLNRLLLEVVFPAEPYLMLAPRKLASTATVADKDQVYRSWWLLAWLGGFGLMVLITSDFNRISPTFRFYRDALERHFLRPDPKSDHHPLLSELDTCGHGMPYHLFSGCLMIRRCGTTHADMGGRRDYEHSEVERYPFLFSRNYCGVRYGLDRADYCPTGEYAGGGLQLADAVTVSGSAVSPYMTDNPWLSWFMSAFNIRLGMWLSNPGQPPATQRVDNDDRPQLRVPARPWNLFNEWRRGFWRTDARDWEIGFVADGGFRENLGIEELLVRRCRLIIASDSGNNGEQDKDQFSSLANIVRLARHEHGIEFFDLDHDRPIDLERFRRDQDRCVPQQILCLRIRYPDRIVLGDDGKLMRINEPWYGLMLYLQMSVTGLEDIDLQQIRKRLPKFPDEPTTNQFYTKEQVEAYRMLGYHIGNIACRDLPVCEKTVSIEELSARLKMTFLWECRRENARRCDDVSIEVLFDLDSSGLTLPDDESTFQMTNREPATWLERYDRDADFRLFQRRRVFRLLTCDRQSNGSQRGAVHEDWWDWGDDPTNDETLARVRKPELLGRLLVLAVACNELSGSWSAGDGKPECGQKVRPSSDVFRVGGRERFLQLASTFLEERRAYGAPNSVMDLNQLLKDAREPDWIAPRERFLLGIRDSVFASHHAATAAAFGCCLLRVELDAAPERQSSESTI